ncbi:ATP synthase delta chain, chloroplastic-like isoform X3 [Carex rostrata]
MDALSTPVVASFKSGGGGASISLLKASSLPLPSTSNLSFHTKSQSLHPKSRAKSHLHPSSLPKSYASVHPSSNSSTFHHRAATGYAAALADAACRAGTVAAADVDARRLVRRVRGVTLDPTVKDTEKAEMIKHIYVSQVMKLTQSGGYEKHVVALISLLAKKGKLGLLEEVMAEFSKICDKLTGTKVVVVGPSKSSGDATEFERIAREVQKTSGASRVKVRHVFSI